MKYLALYFDAPLQAYGIDGAFDDKPTLSFPSRSAITGLICASLGWQWDDERVSELAKLELLTLDLSTRKNVLMRDFQTTGGNYKSTQNRIYTAENKAKDATIVTRKFFLSDSKFGALLSGDDERIEQISAALQNPVFGGWLGRKCCIPSEPIYRGVFEDEQSGIACLCAIRGISEPRRVIRETTKAETCSITITDVPLRFSRKFKDYGADYISRRVVIKSFREII